MKSACVTFDPTTVLIGENDCGRSSIMEAVALALGWSAPECEFLFQPFHASRFAVREQSGTPPISIELEFSESAQGEWDRDAFDLLRGFLPDAVEADRRFWFGVSHESEGNTHWTFRSPAGTTLIDNREMLAWLRRRMQVFWLHEGIATSSRAGMNPGLADEDAQRWAEQVAHEYRELLWGTTPDVSAAIDRGSTAASQILLNRVRLGAGDTTPLGEVLEEITGTQKRLPDLPASVPFRSYGTAAHKIGLLTLVGAFLSSAGGPVEAGRDSLTLIENPEAHLHPMTLASIWSVMDRIGGQKVIATHSEILLANARLSSVRRLTRDSGHLTEWRVPDDGLTADELRRYSYHVRSRRAGASFARCWLLVEGETEFWLMSELARICGYEFGSEGVACVEFAQCGLDALIKVAHHLGIAWHLLTDGDPAGHIYADTARGCAGDRSVDYRITLLHEPDIEHCFWNNGYESVFRAAAYPSLPAGDAFVLHRAPAKVIARAIERNSKPYVAALLLNAVMDRGYEGIPAPLRDVIESCVRQARRGAASVYGPTGM